ncbi:MAG: hypothetical protein LQ345_005652, partial [Seirophora villosa]
NSYQKLAAASFGPGNLATGHRYSRYTIRVTWYTTKNRTATARSWELRMSVVVGPSIAANDGLVLGILASAGLAHAGRKVMMGAEK